MQTLSPKTKKYGPLFFPRNRPRNLPNQFKIEQKQNNIKTKNNSPKQKQNRTSLKQQLNKLIRLFKRTK
jgi:uncharacterized protein YaiI (UPF0178 family)